MELRPAGAPSRLLFRGVGVGSSREEAREIFGEDALGPGDGARLGEHRTVDFGTDLQVLWNTEGGAVDHLVLTFTGNPIALGKLSDRWLEVFRHAGADCGEHACYWTEGDVDLRDPHDSARLVRSDRGHRVRRPLSDARFARRDR